MNRQILAWLFIVFATFVLFPSAYADSVPPRVDGAATSHTRVITPATGVISGRVEFADGSPAPGWEVIASLDVDWKMGYEIQFYAKNTDKQGHMIFLYEGPPPGGIDKVDFLTATTQADGSYRITGAPSAPYTILVAPIGTGRYSGFEHSSKWVAPADGRVNAKAGQSVTAPDLILSQGALITGRVTERGSGRPLRGIIVESHNPARPRSGELSASTYTDANGRYTLRVAPGAGTIGINGLWLDLTSTGEWCDAAMRIDNAVWATKNPTEVVVNSASSSRMHYWCETVPIEVTTAKPATADFTLVRGKLQRRLVVAMKQ